MNSRYFTSLVARWCCNQRHLIVLRVPAVFFSVSREYEGKCYFRFIPSKYKYLRTASRIILYSPPSTSCFRDCEFSLDFSNGTMEARSLFGVSTVGCGEPGAPETLEIAQIKGAACVDTLNKASRACAFMLFGFRIDFCFCYSHSAFHRQQWPPKNIETACGRACKRFG